MAGFRSRGLQLALCLAIGAVLCAVCRVPAASANLAMQDRLVTEQKEFEALWSLGRLQEEQNQPNAAMVTYGRALSVVRKYMDRQLERVVLSRIGVIAYRSGHPDHALSAFEQALVIVRELKDRREEAIALNNIGMAHMSLGRPVQALMNYQQAYEISKELKDYQGESSLLNNIAVVYRDLGQPLEALKTYKQALVIIRETGDRRGEGPTLNNIGLLYASSGHPAEALKNFQEALVAIREQKDRFAEGTTLNNIGLTYGNLGQPSEALKYFQQALVIIREVNNRGGEGTTLSNIGGVYAKLGQPAEALKYFQQALVIIREVKDRGGEGTTLNNISWIHSVLGQPAEALKNYQQALVIMREVKDRGGEGITLNNIGLVQMLLGQPKEALKSYQQALLILREVKDRGGEGNTFNNIGGVYHELGQPLEALKNYRQALVLIREVKDRFGEGTTLNNIGGVYDNLGQPVEALNSYQQALLIRREVKDVLGESQTLTNLGTLQRELRQYGPAIDSLQAALSIQLDARSSLMRKDRQTFLDQSQGTAKALVGLLIEQQRPADAFRWVNVFGSVDLADYSRLIDAQLNDPQAQAALTQWRQQQQSLAAMRKHLQDSADSRQLQQLVEQEAELRREAEALINRYPEIAEMLETRPADLQRLQAGIAADTVVLQPALLTNVNKQPDTAALFVLTSTSVQVVSVPLPEKFNDQLESYRQRLEDNLNYLQQSQRLYDLLIRPVEERGMLPVGSRLALITSGKLREIPLETLYDSRKEQYLIEKYPVHYLTRLSRTPAFTTQHSGSGSNGAFVGNRRALVVANPTPTKVALEGTEAEASYLISAYPGTLELRRDKATLADFQQQANRYPILHLGTHGCFMPGGCPALGMAANTLLFANGVQYPIAEAARLGLTNTELLVLAACQTARIINDSDVGLSGMAYVLERAGAKAVVASLWSALDKESSQIIKAFYANLKAGMDKAEAMRQAKLSLLRNSSVGLHPSIWAPFIVIGDTSPLAR